MAKATTTKKVATKKSPHKSPQNTAPKAKKVSTKSAERKPQKSEVVVLAAGTFGKFSGYVSEVPENEQDFVKGDTLYIVKVTEADGESPTTYDVIAAANVPAYLEDPESEDIEGSQLVVQEVTALSGRALTEARDAFLPIPSLGKLEAIIDEADGDLVEAARTLFNDIEQNSFYLGGILANVRRDGSYLKENGGDYEGETAWDVFCQSEFGFGGAKGGDLARQYTTFASIPGFDPAMLDGIGWSKLRELQRYVTENNVQELLEIAKTTTKRELSVKLVEEFAADGNKTPTGKTATRGGGASVKMLSLTFKLPEDSHGGIQLALKEAMKVYGVNTEAEALERIIVSWAEEHVQSASAKKRISSKVDKVVKDSTKVDAGKVKAAA